MAGGVAEPPRHVAEQAASAAGRPVRVAVGEREQRPDHAEIGGGVDREGERGALPHQQRAGDGRAYEPGGLHHRGLEGDGGRQVLARHQVGDQGEIGGLHERHVDAVQHGQREQELDGHQVETGQDRQRRHHGRGRDLARPEDPVGAEPVGRGSGQRHQRDDRHHLAEHDDAEPCRRTGQLPGKPAERGAVYPGAEKRSRRADRIEPVIAMPERGPDPAEPGGARH